MKQEYKYWTTVRETVEECKYVSFAIETASEYYGKAKRVQRGMLLKVSH